jgi:hypothetical protein
MSEGTDGFDGPGLRIAKIGASSGMEILKPERDVS